MADEVVNPFVVGFNEGLADPTPVSVTGGEEAVLSYAPTPEEHHEVYQVELRKLALRITDTASDGPNVVTVLAGSNPPANRSVVGDLEVTVPEDGTVWVTLESANYTQEDGGVLLSPEGDADVTAFVLPDAL